MADFRVVALKEKVVEQLEGLRYWNLKDGNVKGEYDHLVALKFQQKRMGELRMDRFT